MINGNDNIHDALEKVAGIKRIISNIKEKVAPLRKAVAEGYQKGRSQTQDKLYGHPLSEKYKKKQMRDFEKSLNRILR